MVEFSAHETNAGKESRNLQTISSSCLRDEVHDVGANELSQARMQLVRDKRRLWRS